MSENNRNVERAGAYHVQGAAQQRDDAERELDELEQIMQTADRMPLDTSDARNATAGQTVRRIALDSAQDTGTRLRAARLGSIAFDDHDLEQLLDTIEHEKTQSLGSRLRAIIDDLESAIEEAGYRPPSALLESFKTAMYAHGLTREGAVDLLSTIKSSGACSAQSSEEDFSQSAKEDN